MNCANPIKSLPVISLSCKYISSIMPVGHTRWLAILSAAFCLLCVPATVLAQTQLGADIDGEAAEDSAGSVSLSADGNRLAIGAGGNDGNGTNSGHVRVYEWSDSTWTQLGADIDGEAAGEIFGRSLSLSSDGNHLAIGAPHNDDIGAKLGHVRVYQWSGTGWIQMGTDIDGETVGDYSGFSVSLSSDGNRLANGAIWASHARVYQWSGTAWVQLGADIDGEQASDQSGRSVSLSDDGNRLAIGAPMNDGNGSESGHTRVYQWSDSTWTQLGADIDGEATKDYSGESVSLSADGNRLVINHNGIKTIVTLYRRKTLIRGSDLGTPMIMHICDCFE